MRAMRSRPAPQGAVPVPDLPNRCLFGRDLPYSDAIPRTDVCLDVTVFPQGAVPVPGGHSEPGTLTQKPDLQTLDYNPKP